MNLAALEDIRLKMEEMAHDLRKAYNGGACVEIVSWSYLTGSTKTNFAIYVADITDTTEEYSTWEELKGRYEELLKEA